jgi:hypothetical protein
MPPNETLAAPAATWTASNDQHPAKDTEPRSAFKVPRDMSAFLTAESLRGVAALLAAMPDPLAEIELRRQLCREAYESGRAEGWRQGYEHGARVLEAEWPAVVAPLSGPSFAELELLRWGPGGREHFGDPRPGDRFPRMEAAS